MLDEAAARAKPCTGGKAVSAHGRPSGPPSGAPEEPGDTLVAGTVDRVIFRNPETGYAVLRLRGDAGKPGETLVGVLPPLSAGELIRASGIWRDDPAWGRQLQVTTVEVLQEAGTDALMSFLASGVVAGVGARLAQRLVEHFGQALPEVLARTPARLEEVPGIGAKLRQRIVEAWGALRAERDLLLFLHAHGLGPARARAILAVYGERALPTITADPYALARDVRGMGFHTADEVAKRLGITEDAMARRIAALEHVLREAAEAGHCALPQSRLVRLAAELLQQPPGGMAAALATAQGQGLLEVTGTDEQALVQTAQLARAERRVAERLASLAAASGRGQEAAPEALLAAEEALGLELAAMQRQAVTAALHARLLVITGGPGTGKTTLVRAILAAVASSRPAIALCAPTGRAARRLAESTGREAKTIHRLLEADPNRGFRRHAGRPLEADLVVVDECPMVDVQLMDGLLQALPPTAALLLVGDVDQLPSVGPGQVLADIIASGVVPVVRLTEIFRQAALSRIVTNAHAINRGEAPSFEHPGSELGDFYGVRAEGPEDATRKVIELVAGRIPARFGFDPLRDVQVLVPVNRGAVGTRELNRALAAELNPAPTAAITRGERRYAVGDKVMQIENDYERDVYNGDIGRIAGIDEASRTVLVTIDGRDIAYRFAELDQLAPAFAVTVHKAQGSEYPGIVLVLMRQHGRMLRRRLFYTAITRAKRLVVLVAEADAVDRAVRDIGERARITLLQHRLRAGSHQP